MTNLQTSKFQELSSKELQTINGGFVCGGLCVFAIVAGAGLVGTAVGYGIAAALD